MISIQPVYDWWRGRRRRREPLYAFFDESERQNGVFVVAGVLFDETAALQFDAEWRALHGARLPFHMADLVGGRRIYKDLSRSERDGLLKQSVTLINRHRALSVAVVCTMQDMKEAAPEWAKELSHAYTMCAHFCLALTSQWLDERKDQRQVTYYIEAGHKHEAAANRLLNSAQRFNNFKTLYQYGAHDFLGKHDATPLHAADLWAWEFAKYYDETHLQKKRPMRGSAIALMNGFLERHKFTILDRPLIERFYREWREKADSVTADEALAALNAPGRHDR